MSVLESFLIGDFLVGDPPPNKTRVAKFPFPTLLVRPGNWKAQYAY